MTPSAFRAEIKEKLRRNSARTLLRVALPPALRTPVELTGSGIENGGEQLFKTVGAAPGDNLTLLLLPHSEELFLLEIGCVLNDACPAVLPWPTNRIDAEKYQRNLVHQLQNLPAARLVTIPRLADNLRPFLPYEVVGLPIENAAHYDRLFANALALDRPEDRPAREPAPFPDGTVLVQFSGGTTGVQKAVPVTAAMLEAQLRILRNALDFTRDDVVVSWLPMYHDMGLIACLWFPLWWEAASIQFAAADWLLSPELLFRYIEQFRGTYAWLPNFGFSYLAQRREAFEATYAVGHMRGWINCSEPVRRSSIDAFARAFADWGVKPGALQSCYAMAENTFAVAQSAIGAPATQVRKSAVEYGATSLGFELADEVFVSSGHVLPENEVRITSADGSVLPDGKGGQIEIRTSSLFPGYWRPEGVSRETFSSEGFHRTGDFGFLADGQLYVIGRMNDMIIAAGQNIFPEDIEALVNGVTGVYAGRAVAFGILEEEYGTQVIAVVAEMRGEFDDAAARNIEREIRSRILVALGTAPRYVSVVPERWIVKSTAGKISRRDTRERFLKEKKSKAESAARG